MLDPLSISRRRLLQGGLAAGSLLLPQSWVWAQSESAARLLRVPRHALIVGNSLYRNFTPLRNPRNDATALAAALTEARFSVTTVLDATREEMLAAIRRHVELLAATKSVGMFFYAGHGVQVDWRNYLLPVDAAISTLPDIAAKCVDVGTLMSGLQSAGNPMNVVILDACRNNPFESGVAVQQKGLSQMDAPAGTLLAYATAPGNYADDGQGTNGLYTENLLRELRVREAKIEDVFKRVRLGVRMASKGRQIPWESTSLEEDFYFIPPESLRQLSQAQEERLFAEERALFEAARGSKDVARIAQYLERYPGGRFVELAQVMLDRELAAKGEKRVEIASSQGNPNTQGSARANTRYAVGDTYRYSNHDRLTGRRWNGRHTVTEITDDEVLFNGGTYVLDLLGNKIRTDKGRRFTPRQDLPLEYAVGKRWTTRFEATGGGEAEGTLELELRIPTRERITVPAGTFDCFRIEGRGLSTNTFRDPIEVRTTYWRAPDKVREVIALEEHRRFKTNVSVDYRAELAGFRQA